MLNSQSTKVSQSLINRSFLIVLSFVMFATQSGFSQSHQVPKVQDPESRICAGILEKQGELKLLLGMCKTDVINQIYLENQKLKRELSKLEQDLRDAEIRLSQAKRSQSNIVDTLLVDLVISLVAAAGVYAYAETLEKKTRSQTRGAKITDRAWIAMILTFIGGAIASFIDIEPDKKNVILEIQVSQDQIKALLHLIELKTAELELSSDFLKLAIDLQVPK